MKSSVAKSPNPATAAAPRPKTFSPEPGIPYVLVPLEVLREVVREEASVSAFAQHAEIAITASRPELAKLLGISLTTVDALRREGMPETRLVDSPRFIVADVVEWLRTRGKGGGK
jgi:hypothetical protein